MKIKVSIEAVGWYLGSLVSSYNETNGVPPADPREYLPEVPDMLAHLRRGGDDAAFLRLALRELVHGKELTSQIAAYLCGWSSMDVGPEKLRPILEFMLQQIDEHIRPPVVDGAEIEFLSMGMQPSEWRAGQRTQNAGVAWHQPDSSKQPIQSVVSPASCSRSGFWFTPAQVGSRRYFKSGDVMPSVGGDYGATIWQWDQNQDPPKL